VESTYAAAGPAGTTQDGALAILIIDDDAGDRMLCQRSLKDAFGDSLRFVEADSGESGMELVEKSSACLASCSTIPCRASTASMS
jgi:CheY-like chemotaxis protein